MSRLWILLLAFPSSALANPYTAERLYHDSMAAYRRGDYRAALEGFMDVLLEEPGYPQARERMGQAAKQLLKREEVEVERERKKLMEEIGVGSARSRGPLPPSAEDKDYQAALDKAVALAGDPERAAEAVDAYAQALGRFSIDHDKLRSFVRGRARFQQALLKAFPETAETPMWRGRIAGQFNTGDLAGDILAGRYQERVWAEKRKGLYMLPRQRTLEDETSASRQVQADERRIDLALRRAGQAFRRSEAGRHEEALRLWEEVLKADPENPEATFYAEAARAKIAPAAPVRTAAAAAPLKRPAARPKPRPAPARDARPAAKEEPKVEPKEPEPAPAAAQEGLALQAQEYYEQGIRDYSTGRLDDAVLHWKASLELDPDHPKARKALERALKEKGP